MCWMLSYHRRYTIHTTDMVSSFIELRPCNMSLFKCTNYAGTNTKYSRQHKLDMKDNCCSLIFISTLFFQQYFFLVHAFLKNSDLKNENCVVSKHISYKNGTPKPMH